MIFPDNRTMKSSSLLYLATFVLLLFGPIEKLVWAEESRIELEFLIAGIKHNDSLVKSSKVHFIKQPTHTEFEKKFFGVSESQFEGDVEVIFAHEGSKVYCQTLSATEPGRTRIFDGEQRQIEIHKRGQKRRIAVRGALTIGPRNYFHYWGREFLGKPVGEYLEKNAVGIVGEEDIHGVPCAVVEAKLPWKNKRVTFWIAPSQGYRVLKREYETSYRDGIPAAVTMVLQYQKVNGVWIPKSGNNTTLALNQESGKQELLFGHTLTVKHAEVNIDVSELFNFEIPPDTEVWDHRTQSIRTAKEAGIN